MPIADKNRIYDGCLSLEGGVDAGRHPSLLDPNQCESADNLSFRGGDMKTRPGIRKLDERFADYILQTFEQQNGVIENLITFSVTVSVHPSIRTDIPHRLAVNGRVSFISSGTLPVPLVEGTPYFVISDGFTTTEFRVSLSVGGPEVPLATSGTGTLKVIPFRINTAKNSEAVYRTGIMQCALGYSPHGNEDCIMASIGGRLFKIIPGKTDARVSEVVVDDPDSPYRLGNVANPYRNRNDLPIAYMVQADKWLIVQDGNSKAIIYDGVTARRSKTVGSAETTEIPTGTIMAYGMGRIVVIVNDRDVAFGDLYGSHDTEDPADSLILFTERNFLAEGFDAAVPFQQGKATGMAFFPQLDTSTGNGQLLVFSERGATSFFMSLPREQWKTSQFQIFALLTTGVRGHRSISTVNEDLWFRSEDGIRSYRQARSEATGWAHIPLSTNVRQFIDNDWKQHLRFNSSVYFDNRMLMTASPYWNHGRPLHTGAVVVDFDILSSFGTRFKPAWEGRWKLPKVKISQIVTGNFHGVSRTFFFGVDEEGNNQLYELSMDDKDDWDGQRIEWEMVSRMFDFSKLSQDSNPFSESELYDLDLWLNSICFSTETEPEN